MKTKLTPLLTLLLATSLAISSCKKEEDPAAAEVELAEQGQDEAVFSAETDQVLADLDLVVFNNVDVQGRLGTLCGATIDSNGSMINITFDGSTRCNGRTRAGLIILSLYRGRRWSDPGAEMGVEFRSFIVRRVADGRQFNISGTGKIYNTYGGLARSVFAGNLDSLVHRIRFSGLRMNGNGFNIQELNVAKTRKYIYKGNNFYSTSTRGDTTVMGQTLVGVWGRSRGNKEFATRYNRPVRANNSCGWYKPGRSSTWASGAPLRSHSGLRKMEQW